jgi:hypothetical protein
MHVHTSALQQSTTAKTQRQIETHKPRGALLVGMQQGHEVVPGNLPCAAQVGFKHHFPGSVNGKVVSQVRRRLGGPARSHTHTHVQPRTHRTHTLE